MVWFRFSVKYYDYDDGDGKLLSRIGISVAESFRDAINQLQNWFGENAIEKFSIEWISEEDVPLDMEDTPDNQQFLDEFEFHLNHAFEN